MFDPHSFWTFAQGLLGSADECRCRVAAGRAYYAFFLTVRERLKGMGVVFREEAGDHGKALEALRQQHKYPIADTLGSLYRLRETADYVLEESVTTEQVEYAMENASIQYELAKVL